MEKSTTETVLNNIRNAKYSDVLARLVGFRIVDARVMTQADLDVYGWDESADTIPVRIVMEGDDGTRFVLVPAMDPEGNGPGFLFIDLE